MPTPQLDLSQVPHMEKRQEVARLDAELERIDAAKQAAREPLFAKQKQLNDEDKAICAPFEAQWDAVQKQIEALASGADWDDDGSLVRCALTGLPILGGDAVITDEDTGEKILRCVLPWPEKPADDAEESLAP